MVLINFHANAGKCFIYLVNYLNLRLMKTTENVIHLIN